MTATEARTTALSAPKEPAIEVNFRDRCLQGVRDMTSAGRFNLKIHLLTGYGKRPDSTEACHKVMQYLREQGYEVSEPVSCPNDHLKRQAITISW